MQVTDDDALPDLESITNENDDDQVMNLDDSAEEAEESSEAELGILLVLLY
jgi:hypothetical protein